MNKCKREEYDELVRERIRKENQKKKVQDGRSNLSLTQGGVPSPQAHSGSTRQIIGLPNLPSRKLAPAITIKQKVFYLSKKGRRLALGTKKGD
jgi:hypothetical protein